MQLLLLLEKKIDVGIALDVVYMRSLNVLSMMVSSIKLCTFITKFGPSQ